MQKNRAGISKIFECLSSLFGIFNSAIVVIQNTVFSIASVIQQWQINLQWFQQNSFIYAILAVLCLICFGFSGFLANKKLKMKIRGFLNYTTEIAIINALIFILYIIIWSTNL